MKQNVFISNNDDQISLTNFLLYAKLDSNKTETIHPSLALSRTTAHAVFAKICDPFYTAAAMDGIAVVAEDTFGANEITPLVLKEEQFQFINTGGVVDKKYNAVIMIEDVTVCDEGVSIISAAHPWQHIRTIGENIVAGEMILPSLHTIRPADIGALIAGGVTEIEVFAKIRVGVLPTGSEIVSSVTEIGEGKIIDSNSHMIAAQIQSYGALSTAYSPVGDDYEKLLAAVRCGIEQNDMLIINAGTSTGTKDYTLQVIEDLGEVFVHGIALKPGKPTILGLISGKPVIGLPGYPVSAYLVCETIVRPIVELMMGVNRSGTNTVNAILTRKISSSYKHREIVRVALGVVDGRLLATPLERGAAATMSLVRADGMLSIERLNEGVEAGSVQNITLLKPLIEIENRLTIVGSHDLMLDIIADKIPLSSSHTGSVGGMTALRNNECHIAPIHLLDEVSGEYNISFVKKMFPKEKMTLIKGVGRIQGLILPKGSKNITGIKDIYNKQLMSANRQKGAGTRILFDYLLKGLGISPANIKGYDKEYSTHMAVAAAVKSGACDVGLGILGAAVALKLDFIPIYDEEYDFLIRANMLENKRITDFITILKSADFINQMNKIGGYSFENTGKIINI